MAFPYTATFPDGTAYPTIPLGGQVVPVANQSELDSKIASLQPGQRLVLASGSYTTLTVTGKNGTSSAGISIVAATRGGPKFSGGAVIKDCSYLTLDGLAWPQDTPGDTVQFRGTSNRCKLTRCTVGPTTHPGSALTGEAGSYVFVGDDCHTIDLGYNELRNKARSGNGIRVYGNFTTYVGCKRVRIHHNDIHDFYPAAVNDFEPIRYGVSTMSRTDAYGVIERNVLTNIRSEPELISGKMAALRITGNVAKTCSGSMVIRHGRNCTLADNYAIDRANTTNTNGEGSGGYRFYDSGHLVERNYADGLVGTNFQDPLIIDTGDAEGSSTDLAAHWRVIGATVQGNVIINCPVGVTIGDNYSSAPSGITVRNNVAVGVTSAVAVTQRITPVSSTVDATNVYYSTPGSGGFAQDTDGIWRKLNYGPRLTYLPRTSVGPAGDLTESDGTGALLSGTGPGTLTVNAGPDLSVAPGAAVSITAVETGSLTVTSRKWELITADVPPPATDPTVAAEKYAWGTPLSVSDEFNYTGVPDPTKWSMYDGPGHDGNGRRVPARATVSGGKLVGTGLNNGDSFGMAHRFDQQYGRWEVRMRCFETGSVIEGARYHVVFIIWPDSDAWPEDGEYDFVELSIPGQQTLEAYMHFPHDANAAVQQRYFSKSGVDTSQWHNYAFEWTSTALVGYIDGVEWFRTSGGASSIRRDIQTMPSGHLTIQLDNFDGTNQTPAQVEVEWARAYSLAPQGGGGGTPAPAAPARNVHTSTAGFLGQFNFSATGYILGNRFELPVSRTIDRWYFAINGEGSDLIGGREGYGNGNGGTWYGRIVTINPATGLPTSTVVASETVAANTAHTRARSEFGLSLTHQLHWVQFPAVTLQADTLYAFLLSNTDPNPGDGGGTSASESGNHMSANLNWGLLTEVGPNGRNNLDAQATGATFGYSPRETTIWSPNGGSTWRFGNQVGWYDTEANDPNARLWIGGYRISGGTSVAHGWPFYNWPSDATGGMSVTYSNVGKSVSITKAGGCNDGGGSVGTVTVTNVSTGQAFSTPSLGSGFQTGNLSSPVAVTAGQTVRIACTGRIGKGSPTSGTGAAFGLGSRAPWQYSISSGQEMPMLFALPHFNAFE